MPYDSCPQVLDTRSCKQIDLHHPINAQLGSCQANVGATLFVGSLQNSTLNNSGQLGPHDTVHYPTKITRC